MRAIVIVLVCVGLVMAGVWKISNLFASGMRGEKPTVKQPKEKVEKEPEKEPEKPAKEPEPVSVPVYGPPLPPDYVAPSKGAPEAQTPAAQPSGLLAKKPTVVRVFRFVNRQVPPIAVLGGEVTAIQDFAALIDERSNAWIIRSSAEMLDQYAEVVKALDVRPEQVDLDFLLVAVSQDRIADLGLSGLLQSGAPHLEGMSLAFDSSGLNLRVGGASLSLDVERAKEAVHVVTVPVVRAMTGEPFKLDSVDELPIAETTYREQTETRSFQYRKVGLGISGKIQRVGDSFMLAVKQSNGSVVRESQDAPTFRTSETETAAWLSPNAWTVVSGLTMERRVWRRGFLERKDDQEKDLVLLFARARTAVGAAQVSEFVAIDGLSELDAGEHPLLPPRPDVAGSDAKQPLEEMEADFLRERASKPRKVRLGPRHR